MPALFNCDKCGLQAWNRTPSDFAKMLSSHVLIRGTICPSCGHDLKTNAIGDEEPEAPASAAAEPKPEANLPDIPAPSPQAPPKRPWWKFWGRPPVPDREPNRLVACGVCQTLLHTNPDFSDPFALKTQLVASQIALEGDGYALNAYRDKGQPTCPICGFAPLDATFKGQPPFPTRSKLICKTNLEELQLEFSKRHARVHLATDKRGMRYPHQLTPHYLFAHYALRHFALAGSLSRYNAAIGAIALANSETSQSTIEYLCDLVNQESAEPLDPKQIKIDTFAIQDGTFIVATLPVPTFSTGAYFVGIATNAKLNDLDPAVGDDQTRVLYFTLELAERRGRREREWTILGEWKPFDRKNYGYGPNPNLNDFLECVNLVWVSRLWE
jgi:hypothetical protein